VDFRLLRVRSHRSFDSAAWNDGGLKAKLVVVKTRTRTRVFILTTQPMVVIKLIEFLFEGE
jgi:hypothetical protein